MARVRLAAGLLIVLLAAGCEAPPRPSADVAVATPEPSAAPHSIRTPPPEDLPRDRALRAGFLIVNGVYNSELVAPYDIFHHTPFHTEPGPGIEVFTVSPDGEAVVSFEGLTITPHHSFETAPAIDILVVPSAEGSMDVDLENRELIDWVRETGQNAQFVVSLCDGAFVLAEAGLLDGHVVTTFPGDQDRFAETFPDLTLERKPGFVHDGKVMTSQGGAKSYDVAMYLVDHVFGEQVAQGVGRGLIIPWPPETMQGVTIMRTPLDSP
jgi:transcriptional regulator GlxA family with amidase domain